MPGHLRRLKMLHFNITYQYHGETRFGPYRVAADMEGNGEFETFIRIFGEIIDDF